MSNEILIALLSGVTGGVISPILLTLYTDWQKERKWAKPRKTLLLKMLNHPEWERRSLRWLTTVTGTTDEQCRTLLIEIGARGTKMEDGSEGWALIHRLPLGDYNPDEEAS